MHIYWSVDMRARGCCACRKAEPIVNTSGVNELQKLHTKGRSTHFWKSAADRCGGFGLPTPLPSSACAPRFRLTPT